MRKTRFEFVFLRPARSDISDQFDLEMYKFFHVVVILRVFVRRAARGAGHSPLPRPARRTDTGERPDRPISSRDN